MQSNQSGARQSDDQLARRAVLQRGLAGLASGTVGLAGCAGGGSDDSGDGGTDGGGEDGGTPTSAETDKPTESTPTATQTETETPTETPLSGPYDDLTGSVESKVPNLTITDWEGRPGYYRERLAVKLTVANEGNQPTDISEYFYNISVFDAEGTDISEGGDQLSGSPTVEPGTSGTVTASSGASKPLEEIASFEVTIVCEDLSFEAEGVYCQ